jgi:hypothetical protein
MFELKRGVHDARPGFSQDASPALKRIGPSRKSVKFEQEGSAATTAVMDAAAKTKADAMDGGMESGGRNGRRSARLLDRSSNA